MPSKFYKKRGSKPAESSSESEIEFVEPTENHDETIYSEDDVQSDEEAQIQKQIAQVNRSGKQTGGFQSFGLSPNLSKAIAQKGFKLPTPIQRKTIPVIMDGRDIVAMARYSPFILSTL